MNCYLLGGKNEGGSGVETVLVEHGSFEVGTGGSYLFVLVLLSPAHQGAGR